jgi:hypothetical protein
MKFSHGAMCPFQGQVVPGMFGDAARGSPRGLWPRRSDRGSLCRRSAREGRTTVVGTDTGWAKARKSDAGGNCLEVRRHAGAIEIRDSKDPAGPVLRFTGREWDAFLDGARNAEFDHLLAD